MASKYDTDHDKQEEESPTENETETVIQSSQDHNDQVQPKTITASDTSTYDTDHKKPEEESPTENDTVLQSSQDHNNQVQPKTITASDTSTYGTDHKKPEEESPTKNDTVLQSSQDHNDQVQPKTVTASDTSTYDTDHKKPEEKSPTENDTVLQSSQDHNDQVDEDGAIAHCNPTEPVLTQEQRNDFRWRSAFVKGFPHNVTQETLDEYFEKVGAIETVYMKKDWDNNFMGSVFVTFKTYEDCTKFLEENDTKFEDTVLEKMSKDDFFKKREKEKKQKKIIDKLHRKKEQKRKELENKQKLKESITPGTILHLTGITGDSVTREYLKAYFSDYARVAWVDFERGNNQAWLRFHDANTAQSSLEKTLEAHEGKLKTEFCIMEGRVLEGEEELVYWKKISQEKAARIAKIKRKKYNKLQREEEKVCAKMVSITPGAILHLTGITGDEVTRDDLKSYFGEYADVAWVDFDKGDDQAWLRFQRANSAKESLEKALASHDGKLEISNCVMEGRTLEGKEEREHWRWIFHKANKIRQKVDKRKKHGK